MITLDDIAPHLDRPRVVLESPFAEHDNHGPWLFVSSADYLRACLLDSIERGEAPIASHALYPGVLDDTRPEARALGIGMGLSHARSCDYVVLYNDLGISTGMRLALDFYRRIDMRVEHRTLGIERFVVLIDHADTAETRTRIAARIGRRERLTRAYNERTGN